MLHSLKCLTFKMFHLLAMQDLPVLLYFKWGISQNTNHKYEKKSVLRICIWMTLHAFFFLFHLALMSAMVSVQPFHLNSPDLFGPQTNNCRVSWAPSFLLHEAHLDLLYMDEWCALWLQSCEFWFMINKSSSGVSWL